MANRWEMCPEVLCMRPVCWNPNSRRLAEFLLQRLWRQGDEAAHCPAVWGYAKGLPIKKGPTAEPSSLSGRSPPSV